MHTGHFHHAVYVELTLTEDIFCLFNVDHSLINQGYVVQDRYNILQSF